MEGQVIGEVVDILAPEQFTLKNGESRIKRRIVILTKEEFPQTLAVEFQKQGMEMIDNLKIGDWVQCNVNLRGYVWTNKQGEKVYINNLAGWRIVKTDNPNVNGTTIPIEDIRNANKGFEPRVQGVTASDDDLPF